MKKSFLLLLFLLLVILFSACTPKIAFDEMIEEELDINNSNDQVIVESDEGTVTISDDGDTTTIESDDATIVSGDNLLWPKENMGDIPELKGKITFVAASKDGATILFEDIKKDQAQAYFEQIKALGYEGIDFTDEESINFSGTNNQGIAISFTYTYGSGEAMIIYGNNQ